MTHPIPAMTDPLGRHWEQPHRSEIAVTTYCASMHQDTFYSLLEYSASFPTAKYPGKMWRAKNGEYWFLCWYEEHSNPYMIQVRRRRILIIE